MSLKLKYLEPKPGKKLKVIGAGLPRTGTNSFCAAVSFLLDGPAYHVGVQTVLASDDADVRDWTKITEDWLDGSSAKRDEMQNLLKQRLDGFVAVTDPPSSQFVPELLEVFPDACVICTVRDRETWVESMIAIAKVANPSLLQFLFYWLPIQRQLPRFWFLFEEVWQRRYGLKMSTREVGLEIYDRHHAWLEEIVPKEKLFYVNVKDGWEPLCRALDVPVPKDTPFPRLNDSKDFAAAFKPFVAQGLLRWAAAVGTIVVALVAGVVALNM